MQEKQKAMKLFKQKLVEISINAETGSPCFRESIGTSPMKINSGGVSTPLGSMRVLRDPPREAQDHQFDESDKTDFDSKFKQLKINNLDLF